MHPQIQSNRYIHTMAIMSKLVTAGLFITATFASPVPASDAAMTNYKANEYRSPDW